MQTKNPSTPKLNIRELKKKVHHLKPIIIIGANGLTEAVLREIEIALDAHELLKIKVSGDRKERNEIINTICKRTNAILIQNIGNVVAIYREGNCCKS